MAVSLATRLRDTFAVDRRSMAAARIAIGALLLADLLIRAFDLRAHYTDGGVLPLEPLRSQWLDGWRWSLHGAAGSAAFESALFVCAGVVAAALLLGWRTRWVTVLAWLFTVSLHNRNPLVLTGADSLLRALLLWGCFLPWGERWSLDARRRARAFSATGPCSPDPEVATIGTFAWTCQVLLVHCFAGLLKTGDEWRRNLSAVYFTLQIDQYQLPLGELMLRLPYGLLRLLTAESLLTELLVPLLLLGGLLAPALRDRLRSAVVLVLALFHLGLAATLALGLFPWVNLASLLMFLPGGLWARLAREGVESVPAASAAPDPTAAAVLRTASSLPRSPARRALRYTEAALGAALLALVVWGNLRTLPAGKGLPAPAQLTAVVQVLRLDQRWNLFAPRPMTDDGWYVVPGALENGELVDVFRDGAPVKLAELDERSKPSDVSAELGGYRWRKYLQNLRDRRRNSRHRALWADYMCREWNASHAGAERATALQLIYVRERTEPPGRPPTMNRVPLGHFRCGRGAGP